MAIRNCCLASGLKLRSRARNVSTANCKSSRHCAGVNLSRVVGDETVCAAATPQSTQAKKRINEGARAGILVMDCRQCSRISKSLKSVGSGPFTTFNCTQSRAPAEIRKSTTALCPPFRAMFSGVRHSPVGRTESGSTQTRALTSAPRETSSFTTLNCPAPLA